MTEPSVQHDNFTAERLIDQPPAAVFNAFADPAIHDRWFVKADGWPIAEYAHDFRVGGRERGRFSQDGKTIYFNETVYLDIVPDRRIVSTYTMARGDTPISASLATVEFHPHQGGTRLVYTEQGAFLDGGDQVQYRQEGWATLLDKLELELAASSVAA